ncbi:hypothetical protein ASG61_22950 [Bacillus sp. Leaf75]|nr:hypothetical protein ASG61_22950 [Bacillus sp. Leaf75]
MVRKSLLSKKNLMFVITFLFALTLFSTKIFAAEQTVSDLVVKQNMKLSSNLTVSNLTVQDHKILDLNGHTLIVNGDVFLSNLSSTLKINKGNLIIKGSFNNYNYGSLVMENEEDYMYVAKDYKHDNPMNSRLSAGVIELKGNFIQKNQKGWLFGNFQPEGTHKFILSGQDIQKITFETAPYSHFNSLILTKPLSSGYQVDASGDFYKKLEQINPITIQNVKSNKTGSQTINTAIELTADASGGKKKLYEYWIWKDGENPKVVRDYSWDKSFEWVPTEKGNYSISVHVKDIDSTKPYDIYKRYDTTFSIVNPPIKINEIHVNPTNNQVVNKPVEISTDAEGGKEILYEYWVWKDTEDPKILRDYSTDNNFIWIPESPGNYFISVHVKGVDSAKKHDQYKRLSYKFNVSN